MFRKSEASPQFDLFTSGESLFSGKSLTFYENNLSWHNQFRNQVTMRIDENLFKPLYSSDHGTPNASIRVMIAMMVLKEAEGLSDQKLFENCRFNMLVRSAIGLINADGLVPTESTYYLFRKQVNEYGKAGNGNLFEAVFTDIAKQQSLEFNVSGKRIRMDSKLLGSNIAWLSRYELIHETLRLFYKQTHKAERLDIETKEKLDEVLKFKGNKVVYTSTNEEVKTKIQELGCLIFKVLSIFSSSEGSHYKTLKRVFEEQFSVNESKIVLPKNKEEISSESVQSPHDTDCPFRNKDGNKVKGYSINVTESCDDGDVLNLIGNVDLRKVSTPDVDFFQDDIKKAQEVFPDKIEATHTDGAYHSPDNQLFCTDNDIDFHLHAIQGAKGRYQLSLLENGVLDVLDTKTNKLIEASKTTSKTDRWRIKTEKGYRYFTRKEIDTSLIRQKIEGTPVKVLQKRNNVEATIFQLGYHYPNAKSRYRGLVKHQMWANMRCLWVNFVRILKFVGKMTQKAVFVGKKLFADIFDALIFAFRTFVLKTIDDKLRFTEKFKFVDF